MKTITQHIKIGALILLSTLPFNSFAAKRFHKKRKNQQKTEQVVAGSKKTIKNMSYEELEATKNSLLAAGDKERAAKYLQKMRALTTDGHQMAQIMLDLADIYFELGKLEKAEVLYQEYVRLYLGSPHVEYACYRAILCGFYSILDADRDQSKTKSTIALCEQFLARSSVFREFKKEVEDLLARCQEHLFTSELRIARHYAGQGKMAAAQHRLTIVEKDFDGKIPQIKPKLLLAESEWARWNGDLLTAQKRATELAQNFPDFKSEKSFKLSRNVPVKQYPGAKKSTIIASETPKRDFVATF